MGLFSNKKTQADGFSFAVDEVYALKEGKSVVVTGKMTEGKVTPGTAAICLDSEGKPAFHCVIKGIEQGTQLMKMASADMKGTYGPHYGFKLRGAVKEDVPKGAVLVPVTDELLETVSETEEPAFTAVPAPKIIDFAKFSGLTMDDFTGVPEANEADLEAVKKAGERDENLAAKICPAVLRLHVIGASNSDQDQQVKLHVKSFVVKQISSWNASSKDELVLEVQNRQTSLADAIRSYAASELGIPLDVKLSVSRTFFPTKSYGDLTFPQGMYDAVEIRLGAGRGRNWWCVLYPELCFPDLTHAVVPEESKEKLTELLGKETYAQLLESQNARLNIQPGILKLLKSLL